VVGRSIDGVDTDDVGTQLLQDRNISGAGSLVGEGINVGGIRVAGDGLLVSYTTDEELRAVGLVEEVLTLGHMSANEFAAMSIVGDFAYLDNDWVDISLDGRCKEGSAAEHSCDGRGNTERLHDDIVLMVLWNDGRGDKVLAT
jgi:hypothetical protein